MIGAVTEGPVEHDLELTVSALKDGVLDLGIPGGLVEIRRWEGQLAASGAPALVEIGAGLAELRGELQSDSPDTATVAALLLDLGRRTLAIAETLDEGDTRRAVTELGNLLVREAGTLPKE
jgi:sirohydrochlorin ferrochelatase